MRSLLQKWKDISIAKKLYFVVGAMTLLIVGELLTLRFAMHTLSATRAFVSGEGLWSKAQKNSAFSLQRYAVTRDEKDYRAFLAHLKVPAGDHQARIELFKPKPDLSIVRQGFLQGRIHPDDVEPMIDLLRRFYWISYISHAITTWTQADVLLDQFKRAGITYHTAIFKNNHMLAANALRQIKDLNVSLSSMEDEFSFVLGAGSRWVEYIVLGLLSIAVLIVESIGLTLTYLTSRSISRGLKELHNSANRIGQGDFSENIISESKDEIGQLADALKIMQSTLQKSYKDMEIRVQERTWELAKSRDQLNIILDGIRDGITVIDDEGHFIYANKTGAAMCGFSSLEEFLDSPQEKELKSFEIFDEDGNPFPREKLPSKLAFDGTNNPPEAILHIFSKENDDEKWLIVKSAPVFDETKKTRLVVTILKDFTEHKRAEEAVKFLNEVSVAFSASIDFESTLQTVTKLIVPRLADCCLIKLTETHGKTRTVATNAEMQKIAATNFAEDSSSTSEQVKLYSEGTPASRSAGLKSVIVAPLLARGKIFGSITLATTIAAKRKYTKADLIHIEEFSRRAAAALDNASLYKQAQEAIQARDEFLSIASHELKTPLTSLSLRLQMTQKNIKPAENLAPSPEKLADVFNTSNKQVERLTGLVEDLLDASRIQTGKFTFSFEKGNLSELIKDMLDRFREQLTKARCALSCTIQENIVGSFDHARIEQIIDNLLSNVVKYAPGRPVFISLTSDGKVARLTVADQGPGIPIENQAKIFERFERANTSAIVPGLGLGLFIVKEIVKGHNASLLLESSIDLGAKFTIQLPLDISQFNSALNVNNGLDEWNPKKESSSS